MDGPEINQRARRFACRIVQLYQKLQKAGGAAREVAPQLLRAGTSIGANLEEATAGQTKPDFITKVCISLKESREAVFWLRVIHESRLLPDDDIEPDIREAREFVAMLTATVKRARTSPNRG